MVNPAPWCATSAVIPCRRSLSYSLVRRLKAVFAEMPMRKFLIGGLSIAVFLGFIAFIVWGTQTSPRLESIRPHLKVGAAEADLEKAIGKWEVDLGPDDAGNKRRLVYSLNGKYQGKLLELRLRDDKLVSAVVLDKDPKDAKGLYTVVVEEVLK
jgi:hypothetical protein